MISALFKLLSGRSITASAAVGFIAQAARPLASLFTLPLLLRELGEGTLGVWMIALSLIGLLSFISSGLSASIVTSIGRQSASSENGELPQIITAAVLIALFWGIVVSVVVVPVTLLLDWKTLLHLHGAVSGSQFSELMIVLTIMLSIGFVCVIPRQVMVGQMHGHVAYMLDIVGTICGAIALVVAIQAKAPLWTLGISFIAPSYLTQLVGGFLYLRLMKIVPVAPLRVSAAVLSRLARDSMHMGGYQIAYAVSSQSDLFLIGLFFGSPASAPYGLAQRIFSLPILVTTTINYAQWPAMAKADAAGSQFEVFRMFRRTAIIGSSTALIVAVIIAVQYNHLLELWLGHTLYTDPAIILGMVAWVGLASLVNTCDSVLRARSETSFLMKSMMSMAVLNLASTLLLLPILGPAGAIWGNVIGFLVALLIPYSLKLYHINRAA